ncbi:uncharacterized protein LOC119163092 isoform X3 [Rhipicephalus microplus]|uniref:uncharacterized protein LOC119163092 isoform X3 n=1 Tax=Rhipicephalus microplus TaxID=6941 RepID=UPI003F6D31F0
MQEVSGSFMKPSRNRIHWTLLGMNLECLCIGTIQLHDCYEFHNVMLTRPCSLTLAFDGKSGECMYPCKQANRSRR